jgi:hypothetical protein
MQVAPGTRRAGHVRQLTVISDGAVWIREPLAAAPTLW